MKLFPSGLVVLVVLPLLLGRLFERAYKLQYLLSELIKSF